MNKTISIFLYKSKKCVIQMVTGKEFDERIIEKF